MNELLELLNKLNEAHDAINTSCIIGIYPNYEHAGKIKVHCNSKDTLRQLSKHLNKSITLAARDSEVYPLAAEIQYDNLTIFYLYNEEDFNDEIDN